MPQSCLSYHLTRSCLTAAQTPSRVLPSSSWSISAQAPLEKPDSEAFAWKVACPRETQLWSTSCWHYSLIWSKGTTMTGSAWMCKRDADPSSDHLAAPALVHACSLFGMLTWELEDHPARRQFQRVSLPPWIDPYCSFDCVRTSRSSRWCMSQAWRPSSPVTAYSGAYTVGCSWTRANWDFEIANCRWPLLIIGWSNCLFRWTLLLSTIISLSFLDLINYLIVEEPCKFNSQHASCQGERWCHLCGSSMRSMSRFGFVHFRFGFESFG